MGGDGGLTNALILVGDTRHNMPIIRDDHEYLGYLILPPSPSGLSSPNRFRVENSERIRTTVDWYSKLTGDLMVCQYRITRLQDDTAMSRGRVTATGGGRQAGLVDRS